MFFLPGVLVLRAGRRSIGSLAGIFRLFEGCFFVAVGIVVFVVGVFGV